MPAPTGVWERCPGRMAMAKAGHTLGEVCVAAMGGSHPLAERVGVWPAVAAVTGVSRGRGRHPHRWPLAPQLPDSVRAGRHRRRR